jgi:hypothetical protein
MPEQADKATAAESMASGLTTRARGKAADGVEVINCLFTIRGE